MRRLLCRLETKTDRRGGRVSADDHPEEITDISEALHAIIRYKGIELSDDVEALR